MIGAGVSEAIYAWCSDCSEGSEVGITRSEAEAWASEHNQENHEEDDEHDPCCSSHGIRMSCDRYRRTHFVEVRPCCSKDAERMRNEKR